MTLVRPAALLIAALSLAGCMGADEGAVVEGPATPELAAQSDATAADQTSIPIEETQIAPAGPVAEDATPVSLASADGPGPLGNASEPLGVPQADADGPELTEEPAAQVAAASQEEETLATAVQPTVGVEDQPPPASAEDDRETTAIDATAAERETDAAVPVDAPTTEDLTSKVAAALERRALSVAEIPRPASPEPAPQAAAQPAPRLASLGPGEAPDTDIVAEVTPPPAADPIKIHRVDGIDQPEEAPLESVWTRLADRQFDAEEQVTVEDITTEIGPGKIAALEAALFSSSSDDGALTNAKPGAQAAIGRQLLRAGQPGSAVTAFRRSLTSDGVNSVALSGVGVSFDRLGRLKSAERFFKSALARAPDSPMTWNNRGVYLFEEGSYRSAYFHLKKARRLDGGESELITQNLALVAVALKRQLERKSRAAVKINYEVMRLGRNHFRIVGVEEEPVEEPDKELLKELDEAGFEETGENAS